MASRAKILVLFACMHFMLDLRKTDDQTDEEGTDQTDEEEGRKEYNGEHDEDTTKAFIASNSSSTAEEGWSFRRRRTRRRRVSVSGQAYLAYGFRTAADRPNMIAETISLFDLPDNAVSVVPSRLVNTQYVSSSSVEDTARQFSLDVGIEGRYKAFSASAQASTERVSNTQVQKLRVDRLVRAEMFRVTFDHVSPHTFLKKSIKDFLLSSSPSTVVSRLGEFYAKKLTLGGVFQSTHVKDATSTESSTSFKAQVKASANFLVSSISGSVDTSVSASQREALEKITSKYTVKGGDPNIWLSLGANNANQLQEQWAKSVTNNKLFPIKYELLPLWTLLKQLDAAKGAALERYLTAKWEAEARRIPNWPMAKVTCASWSKANSCGNQKVLVPKSDSVINPSHAVCCRTPNGCSGQITSWRKVGDTRDNCNGHFTIQMADRWAAPDSGAPFMVGGSRRRQSWKCGGSNERSHCGGGNCMKAHTNSRRRFTLECGNCVCSPDR